MWRNIYPVVVTTVIACFANGVQLGRAHYGHAELAATGLVVRGVGRFAAQRRRLADRAARGGRGGRVAEVKRRGGHGDDGHGEQHHRGVLPRLLHAHKSRGDGRAGGRSSEPVTSRRHRRQRLQLVAAAAAAVDVATVGAAADVGTVTVAAAAATAAGAAAVAATVAAVAVADDEDAAAAVPVTGHIAFMDALIVTVAANGGGDGPVRTTS